MTESNFKWKPDQIAAIVHKGDLVLTASAGTGKTAVLVEKFTRTLLKLVYKFRSPHVLHSMVGITFTELAAGELKSRIRQSLISAQNRPALSRDVRKTLSAIIRNLDSSYISTIHGFCRRILQENYVEAGLSPQFSIIDEKQALELKKKSATETIRTVLEEQETHSQTLKLIAGWGIANVRELMIRLYDNIRVDGVTLISEDIIFQLFEDPEAEAKKVITDLAAQLEIMHNFVAKADSESRTKTSRQILSQIEEAKQQFAPFRDDPSFVLNNDLPEIFKNKSGIRSSGNTKTLFEFRDVLLPQYKQIIGHEPSDKTTLLQLANYNQHLEVARLVVNFLQIYEQQYNSKKEAIEALDFDDLIILALDLLENNQGVKTRYQDQFKHIFVDEFQDVNAIQRRIVSALRGFGSSPDKRTLFIVGDGKQSIYRFRSADVRKFNEFSQLIEEHGSRLSLKHNFRSNKALVHTFNSMFDSLFNNATNIAPDLHIDYELVESGKNEAEPGYPTLEFITTRSRKPRFEGMIISQRIIELVEKQGGKYGDIAVLMQTMTHLSSYELEFRRNGIPYLVIKGKGFYQQREIWDIASYLKSVWFPEDEYALATVLRSPLCLLADEVIYEFSEQELFQNKNLEAIDRSPAMTDGEWNRFIRFRKLLLKHRSQLDTLSTAAMITELLESTGYDAVQLAKEGGDQNSANIRKLIELAREFESSGNQTGLEFILDLSKRLLTDSDENQPSTAFADDSAVKILTIHKSKGLEFPVVILPNLSRSGVNTRDLVTWDNKFGLATKLFSDDSGNNVKSGAYEKIADDVKNQDQAESLRLLYVAATRAEKLLILPVHEKKAEERYIESWRTLFGEHDFLEQGSSLLDNIKIVDDSSYIRSPRQKPSLIQSTNLPDSSESLSDELSTLIQQSFEPRPVQPKTFNVGIWQLINLIYPDNYVENVRESIEQHQQTIKDEKEIISNKDLGSIVHQVMEEIDFSHIPDKKVLQKLLASASHSFIIDAKQQEEILSSLIGWFETPFAQELISTSKQKVSREIPFVYKLDINDISLNISGVIDSLIHCNDGNKWLVDYKYAIKKESEAYRLQLILYSMAIRAHFGAYPQRAVLAFMRSNDNTDIEISESIEQETKELIYKCLRKQTIS